MLIRHCWVGSRDVREHGRWIINKSAHIIVTNIDKVRTIQSSSGHLTYIKDRCLMRNYLLGLLHRVGNLLLMRSYMH